MKQARLLAKRRDEINAIRRTRYDSEKSRAAAAAYYATHKEQVCEGS
jgi:hypothetical protein